MEVRSTGPQGKAVASSTTREESYIGRKKCAVIGCPNYKFNPQFTYFSFPAGQECFKQWLKVINNPILEEYTQYQLKQRFSVCCRHFTGAQFVEGAKGPRLRLNYKEVPQLFLNGGTGRKRDFGENNKENVDCETDKKKEEQLPHLAVLFPDEEVKQEVKVEENQSSPKPSLLKFEVKSSAGALCRICLKTAHKNKNLFGESGHVRNMVLCVLPELNLEAYMNPVICDLCESELSQAYNFKQKWVESEKQLNKIISAAKVMTKKRKIKRVVKDEKSVEFEETIVVMGDHGYTRQKPINFDYMSKENGVRRCIDNSAPMFSICDSSAIPMEHNENEVEPSIYNMSSKERVIKPQKHYPRKPPNLPSIYNLLDENFTEYFSRPLKHAILRRRLVLLQKPERGKAPYLCEICGQILVERTYFNKHMERHNFHKNKVDTYVCETCGLTLKNVNIAQHRALHKPRPHSCEICDQNFLTKVALLNHIKFKHLGPRNDTVQCHMCGIQVKKTSLRNHMGRHYKVECQVCGRFLTRNVIKRHLRKHQGIGFKCSKCDAVFTRKAGLENHTAVFHGNRGEFMCGICGKAFPVKGRLKRHFIQRHVRAAKTEGPEIRFKNEIVENLKNEEC